MSSSEFVEHNSQPEDKTEIVGKYLLRYRKIFFILNYECEILKKRKLQMSPTYFLCNFKVNSK